MPKLVEAQVMERLFPGGVPEEVRDPRIVPPPAPKGGQGYGELRVAVETYYAVQAIRVESGNRLAAAKRMGLDEDRLRAWHDYVDARMARMEREIQARVRAMVEDHPLWTRWLVNVYGVGPCIAGGLIAWVEGPHYEPVEESRLAWAREQGWDLVQGSAFKAAEQAGEEGRDQWYRVRHGIGAFDTVSKFWTFCGLGLDKKGIPQHRQAGRRANWSDQMKLLAFKAGESFVRVGRGYRKLYDEHKAVLLARPPERRNLSDDLYWLRGRVVMEEIRHARGVVPTGTILTERIVEKLRTLCPTETTILLGWRPKHVDMQAKRWIAKKFLADVWWRWREILGLPVEPPWVIAKGGHKTVIPVVEE